MTQLRRRRVTGSLAVASMLAAGLAALTASSAQASVFQVDSLTDDGTGFTLREAIEAANADADADTITFAQPGTITLAGPLPAITTTVTIDATDVGGVTVDANQTGRVFFVDELGDLTVDHLTITGGLVSESRGGGILNQGAGLTVRNSTITGNTARLGGGLFSNGETTVTGSTISGNTAEFGGGIGSAGVLTVANSTLAHNTATGGGGGVSVFDLGGTIRNSTIAFNTAPSAQAVWKRSYSGVYLIDSVLVGTDGGDLCGPQGLGDGGGNLIWPADPQCPGVNLDPLLGPLTDNGGPTKTMALTAESPAINAASTCPSEGTDQRGFTRPQGAGCDIGAFEVLAPTIVGAPPAGLVGTAYSFAFTVAGDPAPVFNAPAVQLTTGSPPPGLSLSKAGVLSGTPTTAGSYPFTVTAINAAGSTSLPVTVTISPATTTNKADLAVTLSAPTSKPIGQAYAYQVATKNTGPATATTVYTFLALPAGVDLVSATPGYTRVGKVLYWQAATVAKNATVSYTATVRATSTGYKVAGAAGVSVKTPDPKLLNNLTARITKITN